ncbi:hypothetical protein ACQKL5_09255 [Peribacillus sp. NPDC097675]|uniref:hypothetical protein n=1 Tax=Peribacillus sp. NPDC097675 TaxID=3390618 RepID=UPI003CFC757A
MLDWLIVMGFIGCLALGAGVFIYFVRSGFDSSDISRIDPFPEPESVSEPDPESIPDMESPETSSESYSEPDLESESFPNKEN